VVDYFHPQPGRPETSTSCLLDPSVFLQSKSSASPARWARCGNHGDDRLTIGCCRADLSTLLPGGKRDPAVSMMFPLLADLALSECEKLFHVLHPRGVVCLVGLGMAALVLPSAKCLMAKSRSAISTVANPGPYGTPATSAAASR